MRIALKRTLVGRRMPLSQLEGELLPKRLALPIFASDPLSSVAYATEAGLLVLITASLASRDLIVPISVVIAALLAIVVLSYRQTIYAYPNGGGSYVVAKENLGATAGLVAAASLLTDYVLTAAVSIASGVLAVTSAVPELAPHAVGLSLAVLVLLVLVNLRGVRESGYAFAFPTYAFIGSVGALVAIGFVRGLVSGWPTAHVPDPAPVGLAASVGLIVILRAFASGCSALTGVEAISNGVPAFRRPQPTNAARTLMVMGVIAILLFLGVSVLAWKIDARPSGSVSVLSEIARAVFPPGNTSFGYYLVQASTAAVLALAANTAFQGFPRLAALLASDSYLPRQFANLGDRLVFSNGIIVLALVAGALIVGFNADVNSLIHLYLLGVFTAFTLSQFGMVRRYFTLRGTPSAPGWGAVVLNGTGGVLTGLVGVIVLITKFGEGAWMVTIAIPTLVLGFAMINRHYRDVASRLRVPEDTPLPRVAAGGPVVLYVDELDDATAEAVRFVRSVAGERFQAVHVSDASGISSAWRAFSGTSSPLIVLPRSGTVSGTVAAWVREVERAPDEITTLVVPELFPSRSLNAVARGRTALALRLRLQGERDIVVTDVPVVARPPGAPERTDLTGRKTTVLLPIASDDAASRRAIVYALGLGADDVRGLHIALGDDDAEKAKAAWAKRRMPIPVDVVASPYRDLGGPLLDGDPRGHGRSGRRLRGRAARDHQPARLAAGAAQPARAVHQAPAAVRGARDPRERPLPRADRPARGAVDTGEGSRHSGTGRAAGIRAGRDDTETTACRWRRAAPATGRPAGAGHLDRGDVAALRGDLRLARAARGDVPRAAPAAVAPERRGGRAGAPAPAARRGAGEPRARGRDRGARRA